MAQYNFKTLSVLAKQLPAMTPAELKQQALDWAYGQLACSTNHKPSRQAFYDEFVANNEDFTPEEFNDWADGVEWW